MPAFTVNRGYPYSIGTDPADVPQALQDLAEAVEADLQSIENALPSFVRPIARVRGSTPLPIMNPSVVRDLTYEEVDFNVGGAIGPLSTITPYIVPLLPGFWFAMGTMTYQTAGSSTLNEISLQLLSTQAGSSGNLAMQSTHVQPPVSDNVRNHHVAGGLLCTGTNSTVFRLRAGINRASGTVTYTILDRSLTIFRMTQS
jgi:hypothetical protein